jgi:hypothetical protein
MHTKFWSKNLKGSDYSENIRSLENRVGRCGLDASGSGQGPMAGYDELGNESSCSIRGWEFLDRLSYCQLLKKDSDPCS